MKKPVALLLALTLLLGLTACGGEEKNDAPSVVVTVWPVYDWVMNLTKGVAGWNVTLLCDSGTDPHSYQPSVQDLAAIHEADLFIYIGGVSDEWVAKADGKAGQVRLCLMDELGDRVLTEETVEGMQADPDDGDADEHIWLSLQNALLLTEPLRDALDQLDPAGAKMSVYSQNASEWADKLTELHFRYGQMLADSQYHTLLFADRFPFRYLCEDYGLTYYAAFPGCSAETEASFETIAFLSDKLKELELPAVCVTERPADNGALANTVITTAGMDVPSIGIDSMQYYTVNYETSGGYLGAMEYNLPMLLNALNDTPVNGFEYIYYTSP